jgi:hypothetical protein
MILLYNVKITDIPLPNATDHNRGKLPKKPARLDIWKYAMASHAVLAPLISHVVVYATFVNTEYAERESEVEEYIKSIFPETQLTVHWYRNDTQADWQRAYNEVIAPIDDDIVMHMTNDDQIFLDNDVSIIAEGVELLKNANDPYVQMSYSHWPEGMRLSGARGYAITASGNFAYGVHRSIESMDICTKERWRHYWFDRDLGPHADYFKPENIHRRTDMFAQGNVIYFPLREQFRHFDGYEYGGAFQGRCLNFAPPIDIPPGFFDNQIRIAYGYNGLREGWVNINPASENLYAFDGAGADYKWALEDIPLFWQNRVAEIDVNPAADLEYLRECRDQHIYIAATADIHEFKNPMEIDVFKNQYLSKKFKEICVSLAA